MVIEHKKNCLLICFFLFELAYKTQLSTFFLSLAEKLAAMKANIFLTILLVSTSFGADPIGFKQIGNYCKWFETLLNKFKHIHFNFVAGVDDSLKSYQKTYFIAIDFKESWTMSRCVCRNWRMELAAFETVNEKNNFVAIMNANIKYFDQWTYIGGIETVKGDANTFIWSSTGKSISYKLDWTPGNPNNFQGLELCLSLEKSGSAYYGFNDIACSIKPFPFICEARLRTWL